MSERTFTVTFTDRKTRTAVRTEVVTKHGDRGVVLKAKIQALNSGFRFDKTKHVASFKEE